MKASVGERLRKAVGAPEATVFHMLETSAETTQNALETLEKLVHHWPDQAHADDLARLRADAEHEAGAVFAAVNGTFVTSVGSDDLLALSDALNAATVHAEEVAALLAAYRMPAGREHARRATHQLALAGGALRSGVVGLQRRKDLHDAVDRAEVARRRAVVFLREGLTELVADDPPATELAAWRDVSAQLTSVAAACGAAARTLHAIELKRR